MGQQLPAGRILQPGGVNQHPLVTLRPQKPTGVSVVEQEKVSGAPTPAGSRGGGQPRSCMKAHGGRDGNVYVPIVKLGFSQNFRVSLPG